MYVFCVFIYAYIPSLKSGVSGVATRERPSDGRTWGTFAYKIFVFEEMIEVGKVIIIIGAGSAVCPEQKKN